VIRICQTQDWLLSRLLSHSCSAFLKNPPFQISVSLGVLFEASATAAATAANSGLRSRLPSHSTRLRSQYTRPLSQNSRL
jgi:hypothetical protein